MNFRYVVRPQADRDIDDLADSIAQHYGLDRALLFLSGIYDTFALINTWAGRAKSITGNYERRARSG